MVLVSYTHAYAHGGDGSLRFASHYFNRSNDTLSTMTDFMKMDIFFVVATLALVLLTVMVSIVLWYGIRLMRTLERIAVHIEEEAKELKKDLDEARADAKAEGKKILALVRAFTRSARRLMKRPS